MIFPILRMIIGLFFLLVSLEKLLEPYQNFLYVVQSYQLFPSLLEEAVARVVPWVQFFLGLFLFLGLWVKNILKGLVILIVGFLGVVGQALIRKLPLDECGCFGSLISLPPRKTFLLDITLLVFTVILFRRIKETSGWSLDAYFEMENSVK